MFPAYSGRCDSMRLATCDRLLIAYSGWLKLIYPVVVYSDTILCPTYSQSNADSSNPST